MIYRDMLREFYYLKIRHMTPMQFRLFHLRRIGMQIGEDTWIYSDKLETNEPYLVKIGSHIII